MNTIYIDNDMVVRFTGTDKLVDQEGVAVTGATVKMTLFHKDGTTKVGGITWPITLSPQPVDGEYSGILPDYLILKTDNVYILEITVTKNNANAKWRLFAKVQNRTS